MRNYAPPAGDRLAEREPRAVLNSISRAWVAGVAIDRMFSPMNADDYSEHIDSSRSRT